MILPWHIIRLWVLISLAALLAGVLLAPGPTLAEEELHHAGLVVRDAEGRMTYAWVPFAQDPVDPAVWTWQPLGASSSRVEDGDVFGWNWTAGDPSLPALPAAEIASRAGAADMATAAPVFRTVLPDGVAIVVNVSPPDGPTTAAAAAILVV